MSDTSYGYIQIHRPTTHKFQRKEPRCHVFILFIVYVIHFLHFDSFVLLIQKVGFVCKYFLKFWTVAEIK